MVSRNLALLTLNSLTLPALGVNGQAKDHGNEESIGKETKQAESTDGGENALDHVKADAGEEGKTTSTVPPSQF